METWQKVLIGFFLGIVYMSIWLPIVSLHRRLDGIDKKLSEIGGGEIPDEAGERIDAITEDVKKIVP